MISLIFAMDKHGLIGQKNSLPWHLPADLKHFKKITTGHTVIMGRKTFESIGKPLPNRTNIILTGSRDHHPEGCVVAHSIDEVRKRVADEEEAFVIGGANIYSQFLPYADRMYITVIEHVFAGDTYFPDYDKSQWRLVQSEQGITDEQNPYEHRFTVWERVRSKA